MHQYKGQHVVQATVVSRQKPLCVNFDVVVFETGTGLHEDLEVQSRNSFR